MQKTHFKNHLFRKNPCECISSNISIDELKKQYFEGARSIMYKCDFCDKDFCSKQGKYQHKIVCKDNPINGSLIKLSEINEQLKNEIKKEIIGELKGLVINNTINNNNNTQNIINVTNPKIRDFGKENMEALPESLISSLFIDLRFRELLANLHCDPNYPENQNIRIKSIKRNTMEIYRNNKWDIMTFTKGLTELLLQGHRVFKNYFDNDKDRILEEDMSEEEIKDVLNQLEKIEKLNKEELRPLLMDLQMMLEEYRENGHAIVIT